MRRLCPVPIHISASSSDAEQLSTQCQKGYDREMAVYFWVCDRCFGSTSANVRLKGGGAREEEGRPSMRNATNTTRIF